MGTHSYTEECPRCSSPMNCWAETRNNQGGGECLECGYNYYTKEETLTLQKVNELRDDSELKPLKKLRKQN